MSCPRCRSRYTDSGGCYSCGLVWFEARQSYVCGKCRRPILPGMRYIWMWAQGDKTNYFKAHVHHAREGV